MSDRLTVLIVEDDPHVLLGCQQALALEDIPSIGVSSAEEALAQVDSDFAGIVVSDIRLPGIDGLELLTRLKQRDASLPVVLITGHGDIGMAVGAMRDGAYDFMEKPFSPERLVDVARRALEQRALAREVSALRRQLAGRQALEQRIIGRSPAMQQLRELIANVADTNANVLIEGETGTGKELVAQAIHGESSRKGAGAHPFVAINCGAIAESLLESELFGYEEGAFTGSRRGGHAGVFEAAHRGTLFLDEIGEMPLPLQTRLLRVLEEKEVVRVGGTRPIPVDVRIVSATHCRLEERVAQGEFRADLFYRLGVLRMNIAPLRERAADIVALAEWWLKNSLAELGARPGANLHAELQTCAPLLQSWHWPGNVRELRNLMQRVALFLAVEPLQALTPVLLSRLAPELSKPAGAASSASATTATVDVHDVLRRFKGNRVAAAAYLGISRTTLWRRLRSDQ